MTPSEEIRTALPDLRAAHLEELPALMPAALDQVLQRILPGAVRAPVLGAAFSSSI